MPFDMITILGPTASGKTDLAAHLAVSLGNCEIISADSRQVYKHMDIGTGKDLKDYVVNGTAVPYHLIDICEPGTKYNLFQYQQDFQQAYNDIKNRGKMPILCGGTGLYIEAVLKGYSLSPVPQNEQLRKDLEGKSLEQLTAMLQELKAQNGSVMHNTTDVDSAQRAIRAIEIEYSYQNCPFRTGRSKMNQAAVTDEAGRSWVVQWHEYGGDGDWAYVKVNKSGGLPFDATYSKNMPPQTKLTILGFPANMDRTQNGRVAPDVSEAVTSRQGVEDGGWIRASNSCPDHGNSGGPVFALRNGKSTVVGILSGVNFGSDVTHWRGRIIPIGAAF